MSQPPAKPLQGRPVLFAFADPNAPAGTPAETRRGLFLEFGLDSAAGIASYSVALVEDLVTGNVHVVRIPNLQFEKDAAPAPAAPPPPPAPAKAKRKDRRHG